MPGLDAIEAPAEDAPTFEDNAREKAIYYSRFLPGEMVLADDSGLEVDFLQGAPGVRSARYAADAGFRAAHTMTPTTIFSCYSSSPGRRQRTRRPLPLRAGRCPGWDPLLTAEGAVEGRILTTPRGNGGFGYDPLFYLPDLDRTMAEIDDQARWTHSHRGQAFRALLELLV